MKRLDLRAIAKRGGYGDKLMASAHDPRKPWYYLKKNDKRAYFNPAFRPTPAKIKVRYTYKRFPGVMLAPHVKQTFSADNRQWPWGRWQALADRLKCPKVQCGPEGTRFLDGVQQCITPTFEHAVGLLDKVDLLVSSEGGLMHAAAALDKPAVIIWGAWSPPEVMGYDGHVHIAEHDPEAQGWRYSHPRCKAAMERITVDRVYEAIRTIIPAA